MPPKNEISLSDMGIVAITFDLDDTLWPCAPVIAHAEQVYYGWIAEHYPELTAKYNPADVVAMRREILATEPDLKNDVTELRRRATDELLRPCGASQAQIDESLRVCLEARQQVSFYDDVLDALQQLSFHYRLGSITNGNADLSVIGVGHLFDAELAATMSLPAKPAPDMFIKACELLGASPQSVLHVGDHPENDVLAAREVGCRTAWINRSDAVYPSAAVAADLEIANLDQLLALAPAMPCP